MKSRKAEDAAVLPIKITTGTLLRILLVAGAVFLIFYLRDLVFMLIAATLIAAIIDPVADRLKKYRVPRSLTVLLVYLLSFAVLALAFLLIIPQVIEQFKQLYTLYLPYVQEVAPGNDLGQLIVGGELFTQDINSIFSALVSSGGGEAFGQVYDVLIGAIGGVIALILVLMIAFYMVVEEKSMHHMLMHLTPSRYQKMVDSVASQVRVNAGKWLRGQLLLMLLVGLLSYLGLTLLQVPYALALAFLAGLLEVIVFIGPLIALIPAAIIGFSVSPAIGVLVMVLYFIVQQIEGDILTPKIMQKVIGLNPVISIIAVIAGFEFQGVLGAILAIPIAMIIGIIFREWRAASKKLSV